MGHHIVGGLFLAYVTDVIDDVMIVTGLGIPRAVRDFEGVPFPFSLQDVGSDIVEVLEELRPLGLDRLEAVDVVRRPPAAVPVRLKRWLHKVNAQVKGQSLKVMVPEVTLKVIWSYLRSSMRVWLSRGLRSVNLGSNWLTSHSSSGSQEGT